MGAEGRRHQQRVAMQSKIEQLGATETAQAVSIDPPRYIGGYGVIGQCAATGKNPDDGVSLGD
jgi:hypothetical protein